MYRRSMAAIRPARRSRSATAISADCWIRSRRNRAASVDSLDDAHVALRRIAQRDQRRLVARAVMRGDRLRDAGELDQHGALVDAGLIGLGGAAAGEEAAAAGDDGGAGKLGVLGQGP